MTPRKPRGELREVVRRRARQLAAEGRIQRTITATPGRAFKRAPDDILIARLDDAGNTRDAVQALELAKRRDPSAMAKGCDARWFVFARGTP